MDVPCYNTCNAPLEIEDDPLKCLSCLGVDHLRAALTESCMHCAVLLLAICKHRLTDHVISNDYVSYAAAMLECRSPTNL